MPAVLASPGVAPWLRTQFFGHAFGGDLHSTACVHGVSCALGVGDVLGLFMS